MREISSNLSRPEPRSTSGFTLRSSEANRSSAKQILSLSSSWLSLAVCTSALLVVVPLVGWPPTLRLSAVLAIVGLIGAMIAQPWRWRADTWSRLAAYQPSAAATAAGAICAALVLFWVVFTLFQGGRINAIDFTVYFDRPLYQTIHGRPLYVETADDAAFEYQTHLGVHAYWLMMPLSVLYLVRATPLWLLGLSVLAVVAGSIYIMRIGRQMRLAGVLSLAAALTFLLNDNTARALRYGFHPEVLYAWFVPWLIDAGLRASKRSYLAATIACVLVKEDAILPIAGAVMTIAVARARSMSWNQRVFFLAMPLAVAGLNLTVFYAYVVPALSPTREIAYASLWTNYGATPTTALIRMLQQPHRVARDVADSGLFRAVLAPFAFLPLLGWRSSIGALPLAIVFGASADNQVRAYGLYYAIYLIPFLSLSAAQGAQTVCGWMLPRTRAAAVAAAFLICAAVLVGPGYALRPWRVEVASVPEAIDLLANERVVLVQSSLYPHAGYSSRVQLLTPHAIRDPANRDAVILVAPTRMGAYPLDDREITAVLQQPVIARMPGGLIAVRNSPQSAPPNVQHGNGLSKS